MNIEMFDLEDKIRKTLIQSERENAKLKVNGKEWFPLIGIGYALKDAYEGKPSVLNDYAVSKRFIMYRLYQLSMAIGLYVGSIALIEHLAK